MSTSRASQISRKVVGQSGKGFSAELRVEGVAETIQALRAFEPEVYKSLRKSIKAELTRVQRGATGRYGGIYKTSMRNTGRSAGGAVTAVMGPQLNKNDWSAPATKAVIFEFAEKGKTPQAQATVNTFKELFGRGPNKGKFLWAEWDSISDSVLANIELGIRDAEATLQKNLDSAGEAF